MDFETDQRKPLRAEARASSIDAQRKADVAKGGTRWTFSGGYAGKARPTPPPTSLQAKAVASELLDERGAGTIRPKEYGGRGVSRACSRASSARR